MKTVFTTLTFALVSFFPAHAQLFSFTKIPGGPTAPIGNHPVPGDKYVGCSWVDYDNNGWLDLYAGSLFYTANNDGEYALSDVGIPLGFNGLSVANTWADFDLDGDVDIFVAAEPGGLFKSDDDNIFGQITFMEEIELPDIPSDFANWSATWGDYDNDGDPDLFCTNPGAFFGNSHSNFFFENNGDGSFSRITEGDPVTGQAPYTVANWSDFDGDGDLDLFVGAGPADGTLAKDYIYINALAQTGSPDLVRNATGTLFGDLRDGQVWSWIDYDNDGDLDGFVTNYNQTKTDDFYRNDDGEFTLLTTAEAGPIANHGGAKLGAVWVDFDSDGWLDCFTYGDGNTTTLFRNNQDGTFSSESAAISAPGTVRSATAGDFNNDGFMDIFIQSNTASLHGLFQNDGNENHWVNIDLHNFFGRRTSLHSKVWAKATINGQPIWQMREIQSQNGFNGHNSYRVHFGLGDAEVIDSLIIEWHPGLTPNGNDATAFFTDIEVDKFYCAYFDDFDAGVEVFGLNEHCDEGINFLHEKNELPAIYISPNPADDWIKIEADLVFQNIEVQLKLIGLDGKIWHEEFFQNINGHKEINVGQFPAGIYFLHLSNGHKTVFQKIIVS